MNQFDKEIMSKLMCEVNGHDERFDKIINDPKTIGSVVQTPDLCMLALIRDYTCYPLIKKPTLAMKLFIKTRLDVIDELGGNIILDF